MKKIKYIVFVLMLIILASCEQDDYYLFNDVARIQFGPDSTKIYDEAYNLIDTTKNYSFSYGPDDITQDTVFFDIYAIGGTAETDRAFTLQQVMVSPDSINAVAETHYKAFTNPTVNNTYIIKAGQVHTKVPIVLLRAPSLKEKTYTLKFEVVANDNFEVGENFALWRKVIFTDRLSKPNAWNAYIDYRFGTYSITKHAFMIQVSGKRWDDSFITSIDATLMGYWASEFKKALIDYNNLHPDDPLKDENGVLIIFP